jgi:hypothetical protein
MFSTRGVTSSGFIIIVYPKGNLASSRYRLYEGFPDEVTTFDQAKEFAAQKGIPLIMKAFERMQKPIEKNEL